MNTILHAISATAIAVVCAMAPARAEQVPQGVLVYHGTAQFVGDGNPGVLVGPFSNANACNDALEQAIEEKVALFGYEVASISPCWPRWSFKGGLPELEAAPGDFTLVIDATTPGESLDLTRLLLKEVRAAREAYRAAEYEAVLTQIQRAAITDPLRKKDRRDALSASN